MLGLKEFAVTPDFLVIVVHTLPTEPSPHSHGAAFYLEDQKAKYLDPISKHLCDPE